MPPEWESWLRYRRQQPPTTEEIILNEQIAETKKTNANQLKLQREQLTDQSKQLDAPKLTSTGSKFPIYQDMEK